MQIYYDKKIVLLKEDGDTSHVCQSYDQKVAKDDKRSMRGSLAFLRKATSQTKGIVDAWQLICVGLAAVRELESDSWAYSFTKVNLHPHHRVPFPEWCQKISHFLQGGESFKEEKLVDSYALLPSFWHGMTPAEKKRAMLILNSHADTFTAACVKELSEKMHVQMSEMQNLRLCLELALRDPSHLDRELPSNSTSVPAEVSEVKTKLPHVSDGLISFQLHPKNKDGSQLYSGLDKFDDLSKMVRRVVPREVKLTPSAHLDVEVSATQQRLLDPTPQDYAMHEIASHCHGEGAKQSMAKRKLDALGFMRGESGIQNDPDRMKRLRNQIHLAESLADISKAEADTKALQTSQKTTLLIEKAPDAVRKLEEKGGDPQKLTMDEMKAIAFVKFGGKELTGNKLSHIDALIKLRAAQPAIIGPNPDTLVLTHTTTDTTPPSSPK